jgi:hypothetical protein
MTNSCFKDEPSCHFSPTFLSHSSYLLVRAQERKEKVIDTKTIFAEFDIQTITTTTTTTTSQSGSHHYYPPSFEF